MNFIQKLFNTIKRGLEGKNIGFDIGLPKVQKVTDGVQKATYTIIAGGTGSGKTSFALYSYIYRPMMQNFGKDNFKVIYYSLEMSAEILLAKLMALFIYEQHGIILTYKQIMSREEVLSEEDYEIVKSCIPWLETVLEKHLIIFDKTLNSDTLYGHLFAYAKANGTFSETNNNMIYKPNVPDQTVLTVIDHLALIRTAAGRTKKDEMDTASAHLISFRNICGYSPLVLMQLNRTSSSMDRRGANMQEIELSDLKNTAGPSEDAELVIALFNPHREKMTKYKDYNIKLLADKFRAVQILKSRYGESDKSVGVSFFGSIGFFRELPKGKEIAEADYEKYQYIDQIHSPTLVTEPEDDGVEMMFTL